MTDSFGRGIDYMRVSITDRCNLRCKFCMAEDAKLIPQDDILHDNEIIRMCRIASEHGIRHIRITGGEPFARESCMDIIRAVAALPDVETVTVTTNGILLYGHLTALQEIGVTGVNISLNTFDQKEFYSMTGKDEFSKVCHAMLTAIQKGFDVKINCIPIRGFNENQLIQMAGLARRNKADVRFIEAMPAELESNFEGIPGAEVLAILQREFPTLHEIEGQRGYGPAKYYTADGFKGAIGFIDAASNSFRDDCNRLRLTCEGFLKSCVDDDGGVDFRALLRGGASDSELIAAFEKAITEKP